ncbi:hypothetical protein [Anaeroselena agilis]|uniref:Endonuclease I n=1 Tax=Anaeroselena agilis TaxID=3063788 RepID=A0ABU3NW40_9FIRM|nr:hypothetical protein [Selenomonadales bacterium 4137-cl]
MTTKRVFSRYGGYHEAVADEFRSGLEASIARQLQKAGVPIIYEAYSLRYTIPAAGHIYTPDFILPNGIIIEGKGLFEASDRKKHLYIKEQWPELDIRFIFSNPNTRLTKQSKTSYAMWCEKYGFLYAKLTIPEDWFKEKPKTAEGLIKKKKKGEKGDK